MKSLREKKMLARMARNAGQPDLILEEEIRHDEIRIKSSPIVEATNNIVTQAAQAISNFKPSTKGQPIQEQLRVSEIDGIRTQIKELTNKLGTLSWGGGGTGIVRIGEADDIVRMSLTNDSFIKYNNGSFVGTKEVAVSNLIISNVSSHGIKLDTVNPVYGWRDIIGAVQPKAVGVGAPTRRIYAGGNYADYSFTTNDVCDFVFHIPHDYVPNSDIYFHIHWSHNGTSISGQAVFDFFHTYAKGHNQADFPAEKQLTITVPTPDIATVPRYRHRVDEEIMSGEIATGIIMANDIIEVDGLLVGTLRMTELPTIGGGFLFIHTCDIHYQSTNMATRNKAPDFWS